MSTPQRKPPPKKQIQQYNETLSPDQRQAKSMIESKIITCITGNYGSGKTYVAICYALEKLALARYKSDISGIVITRPVVFEKERNLGFLPGDLFEKMEPFLSPMLAIIKEFQGGDAYLELLKNGILDIAPLLSLQGRTFTNKVIIVDEAQNLTHNDVEDLFSRIGIGSRMIFVGDIRQCKLPKKTDSGFPRLCSLSEVSDNIGLCELSTNFRNPIVEELRRIW